MANLDVSGSSSTTGTPRRLPVNGPEERPIKTDFLCRVKYNNALPDIPFDTKFLACPFVSLSRFTDYKSSSLEKNFKFELLCEPDCGVNIDLINPETYYVDVDSPKKHHPIDLELLEDEQINPQNLRRSLQHSKMVPWMRKTEYISSEFTRFGVSAERQETRIGYSTKKKFQTDVLYRDRVSQIAAINKTFDDASKTISHHPTKKGVIAIEELPLLPDFDVDFIIIRANTFFNSFSLSDSCNTSELLSNWMHPFALVVFDGDPIPQNDKVDAQTLMPQALIRGMMDEEGEQFVTYFLPSKETLDKRLKDAEKGLEFDPDYVYEYQSVRDYNWLVRNKSTKGYEQDNFLFTIRDGAVYYNELETKQETKLMVRNRAYDENELNAQQERLNNLLHPYDEKDDEGSEQGSSEGSERSHQEEAEKKDNDENESDDEAIEGLKVNNASSGEEENGDLASEDMKSINNNNNDDDGGDDVHDSNMLGSDDNDNNEHDEASEKSDSSCGDGDEEDNDGDDDDDN
ncbi:unnamed protein product [Acanthocheilonema viteae]|uniref:RNA polymerase II-associated factor 1 homolog n=1 Tax=Acanthocheilonema viteae TaxID=6277 RepID=A0A498SG61_ACAVI|nr:unnamed protein product [Acanthocheilonema viteae]